MKNILLLFTIALLSSPAFAAEEEGSAGTGKVAAVDVKNAKPVHFGELLESGVSPYAVVDGQNAKIELAPHSVGEFRAGEGFHLLRGSACFESKNEAGLRTSSALVTYAGRVVVSYDHKEKSTSTFVLEGQARVSNQNDPTQSVRLDRFRGATMEVGEVIPQLIRQLDVGSLDTWLKGYAWPEATRHEWLEAIPNERLALKPKVASHLEDVKLENYFSAIDNDDDTEAPDYYERKFSDPDKVIAEQNSVKKKGANMKPEEAALIALPSTKIDLGFDLVPQVLTVKQKQAEGVKAPAAKPARTLASVKQVKVRAKAKAAPVADQGDPEVSAVLNRLRSLQEPEAVTSPQMDYRVKSDKRAPASVGLEPVPDTVYDYSQNF